MTIATVHELLNHAARAVGRPRIHLLGAAGEILRTLPAEDPEVEALRRRRAELVLRFTDRGAAGPRSKSAGTAGAAVIGTETWRPFRRRPRAWKEGRGNSSPFSRARLEYDGPAPGCQPPADEDFRRRREGAPPLAWCRKRKAISRGFGARTRNGGRCAFRPRPQPPQFPDPNRRFFASAFSAVSAPLLRCVPSARR